MQRANLLLLALLPTGLLPLACALAPDATSDADADRCTLAVQDVSVLPMDVDRVLGRKTVRMRGDRIVSIDDASAESIAGCKRVIDGSGRFLVPGLNDLHVHLPTTAFAQALGLPPEPVDFAHAFEPYLAHGVTGIRVMSGAPDIVAARDTSAGSRPRLSVASPMLSGTPPVMPEPLTRIVSTAAEGRKAVQEYASAGYDFIKVRDNLDPAVLKAVIAETRALDLYVDGHMNRSLDLDAMLESGQQGFAHLDNFLLVASDIDAERVAAAFDACACFVSSALVVDASAAAQIANFDAAWARADTRHVPELVLEAFWSKAGNPYLGSGASEAFFVQLLDRGKDLLRAFITAGVPVVAGSDALNPLVEPGLGLHRELAIFLEAGLSPYEALRTATANASVVPGFEDTGTLAPGRIANAILVSGNPLQDLSVLRRPDVVIVAGRVVAGSEAGTDPDR